MKYRCRGLDQSKSEMEVEADCLEHAPDEYAKLNIHEDVEEGDVVFVEVFEDGWWILWRVEAIMVSYALRDKDGVRAWSSIAFFTVKCSEEEARKEIATCAVLPGAN